MRMHTPSPASWPAAERLSVAGDFMPSFPARHTRHTRQASPARTLLPAALSLAALLVHAWPAAAQNPPRPHAGPAAPAAASPSTPAVPAASPQRPSPEDAQARVPPVQHRSALRSAPSVAPAAPVAVESWPQANRVVDEVGGWRAYLKEAHGMAPSPEKGAAEKAK